MRVIAPPPSSSALAHVRSDLTLSPPVSTVLQIQLIVAVITRLFPAISRGFVPLSTPLVRATTSSSGQVRCRLAVSPATFVVGSRGCIGHELITKTNMGWLSKIFKGFSHKVSEGHHHDVYEEHPDWNDASTSEDVNWAVNEDGGINQAIALSIAEEEERRKWAVDFESQLKEDEQFASVLH